MLTDAAPQRPPLALLASDQEWTSRALETILGPGGYAVIRAHTAQQALDRARRVHPDLLLLDVHLPDRDGLELCRALRDDPEVGLSASIMMLATEPPTRRQRLATLRAGAWEVLCLPVDAEELLLKLEAFGRARLEADRAREEGLVDQTTGLYNVHGLARRAREIGADALRHHLPLACVVFGADPGRETLEDEPRTTAAMARVLQRAGRVSDALGRLGRTEFAVIARDTTAPAALRLAERLLAALQDAPAGDLPHSPTMRVGYAAVADLEATPIDPVQLLVHATTALEHARAATHDRIRRYDPAPSTPA